MQLWDQIRLIRRAITVKSERLALFLIDLELGLDVIFRGPRATSEILGEIYFLSESE